MTVIMALGPALNFSRNAGSFIAFAAAGARNQVVAGRDVELPERRHDVVLGGELLVVGGVVAEDHVDDRARDEDGDGREQDRQPERRDRHHRGLLRAEIVSPADPYAASRVALADA